MTGGSSLEEREHGADHLLVRAPHALRVDHRLGLAGGAGGEEELRDRVGADARHALRPRVSRVGFSSSGSSWTTSVPGGTAAAIAAWNGSRCEANTRPGVISAHVASAWRSRSRAASTPATPAHRGCRRTARRARSARARSRCRRAPPAAAPPTASARAAPAPTRARAASRLARRSGAPARRRVALREEHALRRVARPVVEPLGELAGYGAERVRRAQEHRAVRAALGDAAGFANRTLRVLLASASLSSRRSSARRSFVSMRAAKRRSCSRTRRRSCSVRRCPLAVRYRPQARASSGRWRRSASPCASSQSMSSIAPERAVPSTSPSVDWLMPGFACRMTSAVKRGGVMPAPAVARWKAVERRHLGAAQRVAEVLVEIEVVDPARRARWACESLTGKL